MRRMDYITTTTQNYETYPVTFQKEVNKESAVRV